ncbi:hypothetical protein PGTUg99_023411 [Puccinia graminis f. sp. tritici]|uniref:Uncharacterized protein n=1 Tax=Puccinia graminis f. sp. tritici TaxID=56615 RepID=A0A5B0MBR8_PUCGR|nr:hypothetical protein PGTUg99_023411 [Puccinia graminis f. sp. tritici]
MACRQASHPPAGAYPAGQGHTAGRNPSRRAVYSPAEGFPSAGRGTRTSSIGRKPCLEEAGGPVPKALDPIKDSQSATQELTGSLHDQPKGRSKDSKPRSALPNPKDPFEQAEYLCKYEDFSFTDCSWVTHFYLVAKHPAKLRNFLTKGPALDLKQFSGGDFDDSGDSDSDANSDDDGGLPFNLDPDQDAQLKIPKAWLTPEKILSIEFKDELLFSNQRC